MGYGQLEATKKHQTMNKQFVPLHHIDALSYGQWDFTLEPFRDWLQIQKHIGVKVLILPTPKSKEEQFNLGMVSHDIRKEAEKFALVVVSEARLRHAGILKTKPAVVVDAKPILFPSPFLVLVVDADKNELSITN